jgi:hypothetical protein
MGIEFWCVECGEKLSADDEDAGRRVECGKCGAVVRVPRDAGPVPNYDDDRPRDGPRVAEILPEVAVAAHAGYGRLMVSLALYLVGVAAALVVNAARVAIDGIDKVLQGDPGNSRPLLIVAGVFGAAVAITAGLLRATGYLKCRPMGRVFDSDTCLAIGAVGAVLTVISSLLASIPGMFITDPKKVDMTLMAPVYLGGMLSLLAFGLECAVLLFHHRLLAATLGRSEARRVVTYAVTFGVVVVLGFFAACGFGMFLGMAMAARRGPGAAPPGQFNFGDLPGEVLGVGAVLIGAVIVALVILCWLYYLILAKCRAGLNAVRPVSEPESSIPPN